PRSWAELEAFEGGRSIARKRIAGLVPWQIALLSDPADHIRRIELRVVDASGDVRSALPVFERRDALCYRVCAARLRRVDELRLLFVFPPGAWTDANPDSSQTIAVRGDGMDVASDPRMWSYCVEYGLLMAPATATYRFVV